MNENAKHAEAEVWRSPSRFINENLQIQVGGTTVWITNEQSSFSTYNFLVVEHSSYFVAYLFMLCVQFAWCLCVGNTPWLRPPSVLIGINFSMSVIFCMMNNSRFGYEIYRFF